MPGGDALEAKVSRQVEAAVQEADVVLFVVDASVGLTDDDQTIANWIRRTKTPVLVVANKSDNERRETEMWEFMSLGLGEPVPVSALHGRRAGDLLDLVLERFPDEARQPPAGERERPLGRRQRRGCARGSGPAAGRDRRTAQRRQATLFNRLVGADRAVVHDLAGTTRDSIDTLVDTDDGPIVFVDTAGMRRKAKIDDSAEYYSFVRALRAIDDADIALLVIDATVGVTAQDQRLAERVDAAGCPTVIVLNKWELVGTEERLEVQGEVRRMLGFVGDAPVLKISALTGKNVDKLHPLLTGGDFAVPHACPDTRRQPGDRRRAAAESGAARRQDPLRRAGRDRSADVHVVRQPGDRSAVPPLHRADDPGRVRPRLDGDEDPGPQA